MSVKQLFPLRDFSLGINDKDASNLISDRSLVDAQDAIIGRGFISKRYGYKRYTPTALPNPIYRLYDFLKSDGTKEFLSVSNQTLYKDNAGTLTAIPFGTIASLTANEAKMVTYKDRSISDVVLIADGGKLKVYNRTNVAEVTPHTVAAGSPEETDPGANDLINLTNFRALAIKKDRVFALAHGTVKNRLSFCYRDINLGYAVYDYWPAKYFFDLVSDQNDESLTLRSYRDAIIVFNRRTLWAVYGDGGTLTDYQVSKLDVPAGCIAPNSIVEVGNNIFYLSDYDVYSLFSTDQNYVSAKAITTDESTGSSIYNTLKNIPLADKEKAVGHFSDNRYYLSFPSGLTLVYDLELRIWSKWTNVKANSFLERDGVLYFSGDTGLIYQFDPTIYNDDGIVINFSMTTKNMDFGFEVQNKKFRRLWVVAKQYDALSSSFNVKAVIDYTTIDISDVSTDQSLVWDEGNWDNALWDFVDVVQTELRIRERGKNIQLILSNSVLDEPLTIFGLVLQYKLKKP